MTYPPTRPDVVVVGAGAAGIAAGRALARAGVSFLILEARARIGGRAWTDPSGTAYALDLGCEWLHSADRNVLARMAPEFGFALDTSDPPWKRRHAQRGFGLADHAIFEREHGAFHDRLEAAARRGADRPASDLLDADARWNSLIDAVSTYYNGAALDRVSVLDFDRYVDTGVNWRVENGYGALIAATGRDLPVRLGTNVHSIDAKGRAIRVETDRGTIETGQVIVTVPTDVLVSGAIRFDDDVSDHLHAAAGLPLGIADKLYLTLDDPDGFAPDTRVIGAPDRVDTGSYTIRPHGRALIEGYFGGDYARQLEDGGLAAFVDAARREIGNVLGHDIVRKMVPVFATGWAHDPFAMGSYSHALPGHADARRILATPIDDRIFFAGEATSPTFFSTAHGAFEEGERAAERIITTLSPQRTVGVGGVR